MSVIIENMCLPDNCMVCPFAMLNNFNERYCYVTERRLDVYFEAYNRHEECPMKESED